MGLYDPKRIPVGAKDAKSLVRAEGGSTRNVGKVAGDKAFQHTDRNDLKRTYVDRFHNGYRKTAKALGLDQQVTKKQPIAKASDIRKPSKKPGV